MNKNKKIVVLSLFSILILLCVFTNPNKTEYVNWSIETLQSQRPNILEKGLINIVGEKFISNTTTTKNCIVFSIYRTQVKDEQLTTIGILKNFIPLNKNKIEKIINQGAN